MSMASTPHSTGLGTPIIHRPHADDDAKGRVDAGHGEEVAAEAIAGVVHRGGRLLEVVRAEQADGAVAHVLALQQQEQDKQQHGARRRQRVKHERR